MVISHLKPTMRLKYKLSFNLLQVYMQKAIICCKVWPHLNPDAGASIPLWDHDAFPPCFRFHPLFHKHFQTFWNFLTILPFPEKFLDFHPQKFLMTFFLVIDQNFQISPLFSLFPPCFAKIFLSPYFSKFPPCFRQIHLLFTYFTCIFSPYFDHDAFMHHPMHVLDAPAAACHPLNYWLAVPYKTYRQLEARA